MVSDPNRICDVPAAQSHDENRSTKVSTFEAGQKITISLAEYIDHSGRFRVDNTLTVIPVAAVDGLRLERNDIATGAVSADIRFAIFLRNDP